MEGTHDVSRQDRSTSANPPFLVPYSKPIFVTRGRIDPFSPSLDLSEHVLIIEFCSFLTLLICFD